MKNTNKRIEKRYILIILATLVMGILSIFSWLYITRSTLAKGSSLLQCAMDIALLSITSIAFVKFLYCVSKEAISYFSAQESMNNSKANKIKFNKKTYKEVKYVAQEGNEENLITLNETILKFYARNVRKNRVCLIVKSKDGTILYNEDVSYNYFMSHFSV